MLVLKFRPVTLRLSLSETHIEFKLANFYEKKIILPFHVTNEIKKKLLLSFWFPSGSMINFDSQAAVVGAHFSLLLHHKSLGSFYKLLMDIKIKFITFPSLPPCYTERKLFSPSSSLFFSFFSRVMAMVVVNWE